MPDQPTGQGAAWLIRCLVVLGVVAQGWAIVGLWQELGFLSADELAIWLSPGILTALGAGAATRLRRRGSGWAWLALGLPAVILTLGLGLAVALTIHPVSLHQP